MRGTFTVLTALTIVTSLPPVAGAQEAAKFYEENCSACHTIGGGVQGGPDLKGVTGRRDREWLVRFLLDPDDFSTDPVVAQMVKDADGLVMSSTDGLTRDVALGILAYIDEQSGNQSASGAVAFAPLTREEAARGRLLFTGSSRPAERGPACMSCHRADALDAAGGRLGPDLGGIHQRLGGARGVTAWLGATPSPMMRALYKDARLTEDEARALAAFLEPVAPPARGPSPAAPHVLGGITGGALVCGVIGLAWSRRFRSVRRPLVNRARRRSQGGSR